jgi:homocysteine S-methyltransferase
MTTGHQTLPQLRGGIFLTDSGLETTLVFHDGLDLPCFASFTLLAGEAGQSRLAQYYDEHIAIAREAGFGFVLESPTWRASADWGKRLGLSRERLAALNAGSIALMRDLKQRNLDVPMVVSGNLGPRGDGYAAGSGMSAETARSYHSRQIETLTAAGAEMISAFTMNDATEATGIVRAAEDAGLPVAISFTVETDATLPSGQSLGDAIRVVDDATAGAAAYFMLNCAHPEHFADALRTEADWTRRLRGLRANASRRSHAELDEATDLDDGDPHELGRQYRELREVLPGLAVLGGCCGTDHRHVASIARACGGQ